MKAYILDKSKVQIGDTIFDTTSGHVEHSQAMRKGLNEEAVVKVEVPQKSLEFARVAIILAEQNNPTLWVQGSPGCAQPDHCSSCGKSCKQEKS